MSPVIPRASVGAQLPGVGRTVSVAARATATAAPGAGGGDGDVMATDYL